MFRRILLAVDDSSRSTASVRVGRFVAERCGASVVVLHLAPTGMGERHAGDEELRTQMEQLRATGLSVTERVAAGSRTPAIAVAARREQADLVVVALPDRIRGSAHALVRVAGLLYRSTAPLLLLPAGPTPAAAADAPRGSAAPILVPLDGSVAAEHALPAAVDAARIFAQPLLLMRVAQPLLASGDAEGEARRYLDVLRRLVAAEGPPPVATTVVTGPPADAILWTAEGRGASLIVMSTRVRGAMARAARRGTAAEVIRHSPVPVLLVPSGSSAPRPTSPATIATLARGDAHAPAQGGSRDDPIR